MSRFAGRKRDKPKNDEKKNKIKQINSVSVADKIKNANSPLTLKKRARSYTLNPKGIEYLNDTAIRTNSDMSAIVTMIVKDFSIRKEKLMRQYLKHKVEIEEKNVGKKPQIFHLTSETDDILIKLKIDFKTRSKSHVLSELISFYNYLEFF